MLKNLEGLGLESVGVKKKKTDKHTTWKIKWKIFTYAIESPLRQRACEQMDYLAFNWIDNHHLLHNVSLFYKYIISILTFNEDIT